MAHETESKTLVLCIELEELAARIMMGIAGHQLPDNAPSIAALMADLSEEERKMAHNAALNAARYFATCMKESGATMHNEGLTFLHPDARQH